MEIEYLQPFQLLKICVSIQTSRHWKPKKNHSEIVNKINMLTLLPDKILHHLIGWLSHYWLLTAFFYYPNWCRVYSISRITACITARPTEKLPSGKDCVLKCLGECGESCSKKKMMMMMQLRARGRWGEFCWFESFRGSCILFRWVSHRDLRQPPGRDSKKVSFIKSDLHQNVLISQ